MIFRNVAAEGFEDGFKHVRIGIGFHYGVNLFLNIHAVNFFFLLFCSRKFEVISANWPSNTRRRLTPAF
jgi:hypothetical protein